MLPLVRPALHGGEPPLLPKQLVLLELDGLTPGGEPQILEERLVTGICDNANYFTAVDCVDHHYTHDCE